MSNVLLTSYPVFLGKFRLTTLNCVICLLPWNHVALDLVPYFICPMLFTL